MAAQMENRSPIPLRLGKLRGSPIKASLGNQKIIPQEQVHRPRERIDNGAAKRIRGIDDLVMDMSRRKREIATLLRDDGRRMFDRPLRKVAAAVDRRRSNVESVVHLRIVLAWECSYLVARCVCAFPSMSTDASLGHSADVGQHHDRQMHSQADGCRSGKPDQLNLACATTVPVVNHGVLQRGQSSKRGPSRQSQAMEPPVAVSLRAEGRFVITLRQSARHTLHS